MDYTIKRHQTITLTGEDGREINARRIGKGRYTEAFRNGKHVYLISVAGDFAKEIAESMPESVHLPECVYVGDIGDRRIYRMPYYRTVKASDKKAWAQFKRLEKARQDAWDLIPYQTRIQSHYLAMEGHGVIIATRDTPGISGTSLGDALDEIASACANYGASWTLEIAKRNCGVGKYGNLVLRDAWFDMEAIQKDNERRRNS